MGVVVPSAGPLRPSPGEGAGARPPRRLRDGTGPGSAALGPDMAVTAVTAAREAAGPLQGLAPHRGPGTTASCQLRPGSKAPPTPGNTGLGSSQSRCCSYSPGREFRRAAVWERFVCFTRAPPEQHSSAQSLAPPQEPLWCGAGHTGQMALVPAPLAHSRSRAFLCYKFPLGLTQWQTAAVAGDGQGSPACDPAWGSSCLC